MRRQPPAGTAAQPARSGRWWSPAREATGAHGGSGGLSVPRTLALNAVAGAIVGLAVLALLLLLDPLGLRPLIARDEAGLLLLVVMALQFAAGFAAFAAATGVFLLDRPTDDR